MKKLIIAILLLTAPAFAEFQESDGISEVFHGTYMIVSTSTDKGATWKDLPGIDEEIPAIFIARRTIVNLIESVSLDVDKVMRDYSDETGLVNIVKMANFPSSDGIVGWEFRSWPKNQIYVIWIAYTTDGGKIVEGRRALIKRIK